MNTHIQEILCTPAQLRHVLYSTEMFPEAGLLSMISLKWGALKSPGVSWQNVTMLSELSRCLFETLG